MRRRIPLLTLCTLLLAAPKLAQAQGSISREFSLLPGERTAVPVGVGAAGTLTVQVQAQGQPLIVAIADERGTAVAQQQGTGSFVVTAAVAPAAAYWLITVRGARDGGVRAGAMRAAPAPSSSGTITISGPVLTDKQLAERLAPREAAARQAEQQRQQAAQSAPAAAIDMAPARAALAQQVAQTQRAQLAAIATKLPPVAVTQMQQRIDMRARGELRQVTRTDVRMTAGMTAGLAQRAPATATQRQAAGGAAPVGSTTGAAVSAAPIIASLSVRQGAPGTPVLVEGSGLGDQQGEVRFIVANGVDLPAAVTYWSGNQIVTEVPQKDSVQAFDGYVYVKRSDGSRSAVTPFAFQPTADVATYCVMSSDGDLRIGQPGSDQSYFGRVSPYHFTMLAGFAGYDEFNTYQRLRNGWRVSQVELRDIYCARSGIDHAKDSSDSGAYVVDWRPGTDSPYVKVRWWLDGIFPLSHSNYLTYNVAITVTGPKGLPYR